jgi:hypothetical protein
MVRAAALLAIRAETLADEIERDPSMVDDATDALRLFAALMRETTH